tara:strand:+ start:8105 stop:9136 length:1032 start_codon:yes stop_codon:yes gene_type:complete
LQIKKILVTGAAGFIGSLVVKKFLENNFQVIGIDNLNDYYSVDLKKRRLDFISEINIQKDHWRFFNISIHDKKKIIQTFENFEPDIVINLAAQAGVRYSIKNPYSYAESNLVGFLNILEACRLHRVKHFIYASSSSVYGGNKVFPFKESDNVDHPISFYAATKKSNEVMAHSYSHLFKIPSTGLRFFTVYGPWGRPDMAPMIFAESIFNDKTIKIFNHGNMQRDFTYIDDVVKAVYDCSFKFPLEEISDDSCLLTNPSESFASHKVFNVGNGRPIKLLKFVKILEKYLGKKATMQFLPMQPGDVEKTYADINKLKEWIKYDPQTDLEKGIENFVKWFLEYKNN